jgi:hypothetical protein
MNEHLSKPRTVGLYPSGSVGEAVMNIVWGARPGDVIGQLGLDPNASVAELRSDLERAKHARQCLACSIEAMDPA